MGQSEASSGGLALLTHGSKRDLKLATICMDGSMGWFSSSAATAFAA
eukprot:CAMPEP_0184382702 /NCGR_PEP_ID=MMETSP0007-20130409/6550_1 /TAXON_ID=97485 /ORGANISM="Prymnesium parvum, Strain Texoma1" /LENGTH=46 /DNA_ID= /DNA_START= /DNA_END= /DNA_ORIENTATION=